MKRIAHHPAHHAFLRRLAWMAWLLLAMSPLQAAPCVMTGAMAGAMATHEAPSAHSDAVAAGLVANMHAPDCCDPHAAMPAGSGHASITLCHCALAAGGPLPAARLAELAPLPRDIGRSAIVPVMLPGLVQPPPLRPPAA